MRSSDVRVEIAEDQPLRGSRAGVSWALTLAAVFTSLLVVPGGLTCYFAVHGLPPVDSSATLVVGLVAMLPGFLMGGAALWVTAHD